jgi:hypothetical protein
MYSPIRAGSTRVTALGGWSRSSVLLGPIGTTAHGSGPVKRSWAVNNMLRTSAGFSASREACK